MRCAALAGQVGAGWLACTRRAPLSSLAAFVRPRARARAQVDLGLTSRLLATSCGQRALAAGVLVVGESGIFTVDDVKQLQARTYLRSAPPRPEACARRKRRRAAAAPHGSPWPWPSAASELRGLRV